MPLTMFMVAPLMFGGTSISSFQTAQTLGRGSHEITLEPSWVDMPDQGFPRLPLSVRYGVTKRLDLGLRFPLYRPTLTANIALRRPSAEGLAISLVPEVSAVRFQFAQGDTQYVYPRYHAALRGMLTGLISVPIGRSELALGVKGVYQPELTDREIWLTDRYTYAPRMPGIAYGLGGSVGWSVPIGGRLRLQPEVSYIQLFTPYHFMLQGGLGIGLGSVDRGSRRP